MRKRRKPIPRLKIMKVKLNEKYFFSNMKWFKDIDVEYVDDAAIEYLDLLVKYNKKLKRESGEKLRKVSEVQKNIENAKRMLFDASRILSGLSLESDIIIIPDREKTERELKDMELAFSEISEDIEVVEASNLLGHLLSNFSALKNNHAAYEDLIMFETQYLECEKLVIVFCHAPEKYNKKITKIAVSKIKATVSMFESLSEKYKQTSHATDFRLDNQHYVILKNILDDFKKSADGKFLFDIPLNFGNPEACKLVDLKHQGKIFGDSVVCGEHTMEKQLFENVSGL